MADKNVTIRTRKFMTNRLLSRKQVTVDEIYKVASKSLSPNVPGQIFMGVKANPPKPGDISYDQFIRGSKGVLVH